MANLDIAAAEETIAGVTNSVVRSAALAALELAQTTGNQNLVNAVQKILGKSAAGNGTAIFYSNNTECHYGVKERR
jgi:hypothetical protein